MLAPLALVLVACAVVAVVMTSMSEPEDDSPAPAQAGRTTTAPKQRTTAERRPRGNTYTVKVGDTLGSIAERTGVPVEQLLALNPDLDPQALVSGQKIKLRE